ncbi:MAG: polyprenyl synthetase family protein [Candidatus Omnitrophota bacterium]
MLNELKKDIDKSLRSLLSDITGVLALRSSSAVLYESIEDYLGRDGKRIRPILFLLSYLGYTKKKRPSYKKLVRCSLALELLHDFLLIHDDIIDGSAQRRGKPALHRVFNTRFGMPSGNALGPNLGIVAGDIIFALAVETLLFVDEDPCRKELALKIFTRAAAATGIGEFIDVINNIKKIDSVTEKDVFLTYVMKTAKYTFEAPLVMGATLAGSGGKELEALSRLGILLGQAFQIQDDLLDVFSTSKKIGKPVLSDLNESKKTLLVWNAYKNLKGPERKALKGLLEKKKKTYADLLKFRKLIKTSGADEYCREKAASLFRESTAICSGLRMKAHYKTALARFIDDLAGK